MSAPPDLSVRDPWLTRASFTFNDHPSVLAWSPDGELLAAGSHAGDVIVTDPVHGNVVTKMDHPGGALAASWAPDGRGLAVGGEDGILSVWDRYSDRIQHLDLGGWVSAVSWSPGGQWLAASSDRTLQVVDATGVVKRRHPDHPSTITSLVWEPKGRRVAAAFYGGVRWYEPGRDQITPVDLLATGAPDGLLAMWDPANRAKPLAVTDLSAAITALSWHGDGLTIAAASTDGTIHVLRPQR